ncbi:MAG: hypothetical protein AB7O97_13905 [Planctomycetota bacterium]
MSVTILKKGTGKELRKLFAKLASAISETVGSLIGRELVVHPVDVVVTDAETMLGSIERANAVVRGALDKDYAGRTLFALFELPDAVAMAGLLMLTPEDVIEQRRTTGTLEGEDLEAFGELGNVLCSGLGSVLRESIANVDMRLQDHGLVKPGLDADSLLPADPLVGCRLRLRVGSFAETSAWLLLDRATAEAWNKGVLDDSGPEPEVPAEAPVDAGAQRVEEDLEDIPAAPIRGVLNAYVALPETYRVLRRSCRRVGLDLRKHNRAEIPNPAAHRGEVVLLDVPAGEERRFDWCRRIKDFGVGTRVVLLLHRPSRARVTQAFLSQADLILGLPIEEPQLSAKLSSLLDE